MCRLLETIRIADGSICNLEYHNRRFNESRRKRFGQEGNQDLGELIRVPGNAIKGVFRCRVLYRDNVEEIQFLPHVERKVESLQLVYADDIEYSLKYAERSKLEELYGMRGDCDEILIVNRGFISDTCISNIVFRLPDRSWVTPDTPLLKGTMRMQLLEKGLITEQTIRPDDLQKFTGAKMVNCMLELNASPLISMDRIFD